MAINTITTAGKILTNSVEKTLGNESNGEGGFADILTKAIELANQTDASDQASTLELVTGDVDDLAGVLIDAEKAKIALELTIQIRNKVLDSYDKIMNMQV